MTPEEHAAWLEGVRQWARERAEREEPCYEVAWGEVIWDREIASKFDRALAKHLWIPRGVVACAPLRPTADEWLRGWIGPNEGATRDALRLAREQGVALVLSADSPDGWRLVDLEVAP